MASGGWLLGLGLLGPPILGQPGAGAPPTAPATPIAVHVELAAPPDCSSADAFYEGVSSRTERVRRAAPYETGTRLFVRLTRVGARVYGELHLTGEHGESDRRSVTGETCSEVVEALSLTAALALDPAARLTPRPEPQPSPPPAPAPPCPEPPLPEPSGSFDLDLEARLVAVQLLTSGMSAGAGAGVRLRPAGGGGPFVGLGLLHARNDVWSDPDRAAVELTAATLSVCAGSFDLGARLSVSPCALGIGGFLDASGRGVSTPDSAVRSWWSAGPLLSLEASLGAVGLEVSGALGIPLMKRRFVSGTPSEPAGETPDVSPLLALGLRYAW